MMEEAKKFLERSIGGVVSELDISYLSPLIIYLGLVNLGYSILIALKRDKD